MNLPHSKDWNRDFRWFSIFHSYVRPEGTIFPIPPCSPIGRGVFTATELGLCLCGEGTIDVSEWKATGPPLLATWWTRRAPDGTGFSTRKKKKNLRWNATKMQRKRDLATAFIFQRIALSSGRLACWNCQWFGCVCIEQYAMTSEATTHAYDV